MFPSYCERSIDSIIFYPAKNYPNGLKGIEVALKGAAQQSYVEEGQLDDTTISDWLHKDVGRDDGPDNTGGLRLIVAGRTAQSNLFDQIPFSEATFKAIMDKFDLPSVYPATLSTKLPHYAHNESRNQHGTILSSFISRTFSFRRAGHALALTYNARTKVTSAIIQGPRDTQYYGKLSRHLKERADLAAHPAFLLLCAAQLEYETTDENYLPLRDDMMDIEKWTGHGSLISRSNNNNLDLFQDLPAVTRDLNLFSSKVIGETERVKSCLLRHDRIVEFIDNVDKVISSQGQQSNNSGESTNEVIVLPDQKSNWARKSAELRQHAEFLANGWRCMLHRYEAFEKNIQVQLAVLYNTSIQRDSKLNLDIARSSASIAVATKRDGSVMKSISLLTMLFLPATFVSTLFAMPLFNWGADRISAVATPHAWMYLAVALPLTISVVALWLAWLRWNHPRRQRDNCRKARESTLYAEQDEDKTA